MNDRVPKIRAGFLVPKTGCTTRTRWPSIVPQSSRRIVDETKSAAANARARVSTGFAQTRSRMRSLAPVLVKMGIEQCHLPFNCEPDACKVKNLIYFVLDVEGVRRKSAESDAGYKVWSPAFKRFGRASRQVWSSAFRRQGVGG